jgi:hypothetical protein
MLPLLHQGQGFKMNANLKLSRNHITTTGLIGLLAAILVGSGEFLLHFDALGRFDESYDFMRGIETNRTTLGHFLGVFGAPLYIVGFWHFMKMLEPANRLASRVAFVLLSYGIIIGAVWIGSRAGVSAIVNESTLSDITPVISLYALRYENLLLVTRLAVMGFSIVFVWLVLSGRSHYPRWLSIFNPIVLILACFAIWLITPAIGIYLMPIALNVAFALLFSISIFFSRRIEE